MAKIYNTDIGVEILLDTLADLTNYATLTYRVTKPDDTIITWTPTLKGTAEQGILSYITQENDLDLVGTYKIQARITFTGGEQHDSNTQNFRVFGEFQ